MNQILQKNKFLIIGILCLFLIFIFHYLNSAKNNVSTPTPLVEEFSIDTKIPIGLQLITVQILNAEAIDSLLGPIGGVVDLYLSHENGKIQKVASGLKILKSKNNDLSYNVLVKETEGDQLLAYGRPFTAVVKNPSESQTQINKTKKNSIQIHYQ